MYAILRTWKARGRKTIQELVPGLVGPAVFDTDKLAKRTVERLERCSGYFIEQQDGRWVPYNVTHQVVGVS